MQPIEAPTLAQKHHAHIEQVALKLVAGESQRQALAVLRARGLTPDQVTELVPFAIARAEAIIAENHRRDRLQGGIWLVCGILPLLVFTAFWFRYGLWNPPILIVTLALALPALIQAAKLLLRKPTDKPLPGP